MMGLLVDLRPTTTERFGKLETVKSNATKKRKPYFWRSFNRPKSNKFTVFEFFAMG